MSKKENKSDRRVNPIDPDKVADNPHNLPYAHHVGSAVIKPIDRGRMKGQAVEAMYQQADLQLEQIRKQVELLASQAQQVQERVFLSEQIYEAQMNFKPLVGHQYHLYKKADQSHILSLVAPEEWRGNCPYEWSATVRMLADHTWEILDSANADKV